ncbi:MAG: cyclic nucleotide-binding domain-containing protein, partial [bacterium]
LQAEWVVKDPEPKVFLVDFGDFAITYEIKFWMLNHQNYNNACDAIRTNIWYKFKRQKITIPFPIRTLEINRKTPIKPHEEHSQTKTILEGEPLFACLTGEQLDDLIRGSRKVRFGRGERLIEQGAEGASMFVLLHGAAAVSVTQNGSLIRVGSLHMGDCFGEMSLLTGEKRTATVRAEDDCEVIEIAKPAMASVLRDAPEVVTRLSELLATRKMETEGLLKDAQGGVAAEKKEREYRATFLRRVRSVFEL